MTASETTLPLTSNSNWAKVIVEERARAEIDALRLELLEIMKDKHNQEQINSQLTRIKQ